MWYECVGCGFVGWPDEFGEGPTDRECECPECGMLMEWEDYEEATEDE